MKISVSILAAELIDLKNVLNEMEPDAIDLVHLDVMDGHFVPQLSFGEAYAREVSQASTIPLDVHLMVSEPEKEVPKYFELQPQILSFHLEATHAPVRLLQSIRTENIQAGLALSPGTAIEAITPLLDEVDVLVLMSVEPGYYGQKFIANTVQKAKQAKRLIKDRNITIAMDGGISAHNIAALQEAGVELAVCGASCFRGPDPNANVRQLKAACRTSSAARA